VVWGGRVFAAGASKTRREAYCLDAETGRLLWRRGVGLGDREPPPTLHEMTGYAASTAAADGERLYVIFATGHLAALDFAGRLVWERRVDVAPDIYGHAASLLLHGGLLLVPVDLTTPEADKSHLMALNPATGETVWDIPRPVMGSWTTPIVIDAGGREELITSARPWVIAYDPASGREYWRVKCVDGDSAPSPIYAAGRVIVANIYARLNAIRPVGSGDVTATHLEWSVEGDLPDICSPLSDGELVYVLSSGGMLSCYDIADGALVWKQQLAGRYRSSPSLAGGRIVLISEAGEVTIAATGRAFREIGRARFGEPVHSCPAFAGGRMFVRGEKAVYCVGVG
jgi:outer membrane protein assembly factor BamB